MSTMSMEEEGSIYRWKDQGKELGYIPKDIKGDSNYPFKDLFDNGEEGQVSIDTTVRINQDKGEEGCIEIYPKGTAPEKL